MKSRAAVEVLPNAKHHKPELPALAKPPPTRATKEGKHRNAHTKSQNNTSGRAPTEEL